MNKIPENIEAGSEIEVQISPFGNFSNTDDEGEKHIQVCDRAALDAVADEHNEIGAFVMVSYRRDGKHDKK